MQQETAVFNPNQTLNEIVSFGEWVQTRRNRLGLSRTALAQLMNCSPATIKKIERDERQPSIQIAQLLANALQIPKSEQEDFIRRARGEFVAHFRSPEEMSLAEAQSVESDEVPPKHNLPTHLSTFIGRQKEIEDVVSRLSDPTCRLLTIVGAGGMGKTRLSIACANHLIPSFTDGVLFVSLAPIQMQTAVNRINPVVAALADELHMTFYGETPAKTQLINYLRRKEMLLVLDNFEHLLETAVFVSELLQQASDIKVLATSRERLSLSEEWLYPLRGLNIPTQQIDSGSQSHTAIDLFIQRAKKVNPTFEPQPQAEAMRQICQLVDGMPLGIELAASWVSQLTCEEITIEIQRELDFLSSDLRNIPDRHRSMRAVFTNSWQRLTTKEQQIMQRLSVFRGGFTREAAAAVTDASFRSLTTLVNKSMIRRGENGRYEIHELMRQFTAEKLQQTPDLENETREKHGRFFLQMWPQQEQKLYGPNGIGAVENLRNDIDNLRQAWQWGVDHVQVALLYETFYLLITFYDAQGWYLEAEEMFSQAYVSLETAVSGTQHTSSTVSQRDIFCMRQILHAFMGYFLARQGKIERGIKIMEEAYAQLQPNNDFEISLESVISMLLAIIVFYQGQFTRMRELAAKSVQPARQIGKRHVEALALYVSGLGAVAEGDYTGAAALAEQSHQVAEAINSPFMTFYSYRLKGRIAIATGNYEQAITYLQESFDISWAHGFPAQSMWHLIGLGDAARLHGLFDEAKAYYERSIALATEMNSPSAMATTYWGWGNLARQMGDYDAANAAFAKSKQVMKIQSWSPGGPGWVAIALGQTEEAHQIFMARLPTILQIKQTPLALDTLAGLAHVHAQTGNFAQAIAFIDLIEQEPATAFETKQRCRQLRKEFVTELSSAGLETAASNNQHHSLWQIVQDLLANEQ